MSIETHSAQDKRWKVINHLNPLSRYKITNVWCYVPPHKCTVVCFTVQHWMCLCECGTAMEQKLFGSTFRPPAHCGHFRVVLSHSKHLTLTPLARRSLMAVEFREWAWLWRYRKHAQLSGWLPVGVSLPPISCIHFQLVPTNQFSQVELHWAFTSPRSFSASFSRLYVDNVLQLNCKHRGDRIFNSNAAQPTMRGLSTTQPNSKKKIHI